MTWPWFGGWDLEGVGIFVDPSSGADVTRTAAAWSADGRLLWIDELAPAPPTLEQRGIPNPVRDDASRVLRDRILETELVDGVYQVKE